MPEQMERVWSLKDSSTELRAIVSLSGRCNALKKRGHGEGKNIKRFFGLSSKSIKDEWSNGLRTINEAVLHGLAVCDSGAYAGSTIQEIRQNFAGDDHHKVGKIFQPLWKYI